MLDSAVSFARPHEDAVEQGLSRRDGFSGRQRAESEAGLRRGQNVERFDCPIIPSGGDRPIGGQRGGGDQSAAGEQIHLQRAVVPGGDDGAVGCTGGRRGLSGACQIDGDEAEVEPVVIAVAREQPLLDGLVHRRGAEADEDRGVAPGCGGRLEIGHQPRGVGHGFELPSAGGGPKIECVALADPQRLASELDRDGALGIGIPDGDLAFLQDELVVGSRVLEERHGSLDAPDLADDRPYHDHNHAEMNEEEAGVVFFPRPPHESAASEVGREKEQPEVEPWSLVDPGAGRVGIEF